MTETEIMTVEQAMTELRQAGAEDVRFSARNPLDGFSHDAIEFRRRGDKQSFLVNDPRSPLKTLKEIIDDWTTYWREQDARKARDEALAAAYAGRWWDRKAPEMRENTFVPVGRKGNYSYGFRKCHGEHLYQVLGNGQTHSLRSLDEAAQLAAKLVAEARAGSKSRAGYGCSRVFIQPCL